MTVALTSEGTAKALPKEEGKDHIVHFKVECICKKNSHFLNVVRY